LGEIEVTLEDGTKEKAQILLNEDEAKLKSAVDEVDNGSGGGSGLLAADGKFINDELEKDYGSYLKRKAAQEKPPRERLDWKQARDYWLFDSPMARGNNFNKKAVVERWYDYNEVTLSNGKRVDSYDPLKGEIISRKATNLEEVELSTFESYLQEMKTKYASGTPINSPKYSPDFDGQILKGKQILEVPESNKNFSQIQSYIDLAKNKYNIEIRFKPE